MRLLKIPGAVAAGIIAAGMWTITAFAEDYEFDVSSAVQSNGKWGQSFTEYTSLDGEESHSGGFDPRIMTPDSEIIVEYTYEGEANGAPCELIWQTWDVGGVEKDPDIISDWNKIAPYDYDDTSAKFSYADIVAAYGTEDFSQVYAVNVGDAGVMLTVTKMTATNVDMSAAAPSAGSFTDEGFEFDVSSAVQSNGEWGQSFITYTVLDGLDEHSGGFDPTLMTADSEVIIEYTYEGEANGAPCELIWQTWEIEGVTPTEGIAGNWNKIAPTDYSDTSATFSYADIAAAYGTEDFSQVYAICVGDTGVKLTVTSMKITNVNGSSAEDTDDAEPAETEAETVVTTSVAPVESTAITTTTNIAANAPKEGGGNIAVIIIVAVVVVAVGVFVVIKLIGKNKRKYY